MGECDVASVSQGGNDQSFRVAQLLLLVLLRPVAHLGDGSAGVVLLFSISDLETQLGLPPETGDFLHVECHKI